MLKRVWSIVLSLMLAMGMVTSALAADATVYKNKDDEDGPGYVQTVQVVGDTLYILTRPSSELYYRLYRWQEGMAEMEMVAEDIFWANRYDTMAQAQEALDEVDEGMPVDANYGSGGALFTDGERLLTLNPLNGRIFALSGEDGRAVYEDVCTLDNPDAFYHIEPAVGDGEEYRYFNGFRAYGAAGGKLAVSVSDWDSQTGEEKPAMWLVDLATGKMTKSAQRMPEGIAAYKDGKLLLISRDRENAYDSETGSYRPYEVLAYDPATDQAEKAGELQVDYLSGDSCVVYDEANNALIYQDETRIMGLTDMTKAEQYGYVPDTYARSLALLNGSLVFANADRVLLRTLTPGFDAEDSVTVYGSYMGPGEQLFAENYPQVPVYFYQEYFGSAEELTQAMVTGDNAIDVLRMSSSYSDFYRLMDKGYCADLSGDAELMAYVQRLHPVYRDAVMKDGKLYAVPVSAYCHQGCTVNLTVMEEMGLTLEDMPTNLVELCQMATRWNNEWVEEYPSFTLMSYVEDYKGYLLQLIMDRYTAYYQAKGEELRFNTPEFRSLMEALEAMEVDELNRAAKVANEDETNYRAGLISLDGQSVVGNFRDPNGEYGNAIIPMTLTADMDLVYGVEMELLFVNPRSTNMASAINLIKANINEEVLGDYAACTLLADKSEAVPNEYYDEQVKSQQDYISQLEKSLAKADDADKRGLEELIAEQKRYLEEEMPRYEYNITEAALKNYQENVVPHVYVQRPNLLTGENSGELYSLMERYAQGQMKLDQFIKDMDSKVMMMQMEDY